MPALEPIAPTPAPARGGPILLVVGVIVAVVAAWLGVRIGLERLHAYQARHLDAAFRATAPSGMLVFAVRHPEMPASALAELVDAVTALARRTVPPGKGISMTSETDREPDLGGYVRVGITSPPVDPEAVTRLRSELTAAARSVQERNGIASAFVCEVFQTGSTAGP
jgi:hypothetical protein